MEIAPEFASRWIDDDDEGGGLRMTGVVYTCYVYDSVVQGCVVGREVDLK